MPRRVKVNIDKISHINDVTIEVYRSTTPSVDDLDTHVMNVFDPMVIKEVLIEDSEMLRRDSKIPNLFYAARHFETNPIPVVQIGGDVIPQGDLIFNPEQKTVEIVGHGLGIGDTRRIYMTYEYQATPAKDDYELQSGITYYGPPATGLRPPKDIVFTPDLSNGTIEISYHPDLTPIEYYYRLRAKDNTGSLSQYSSEQKIGVVPDSSQLYFFIERSMDAVHWEPVQRTTQYSWIDPMYMVDLPRNVQNLQITYLETTKARIEFDNPWHIWDTLPRQMYRYRIRSEDFNGEASDYAYIDNPPEIYLLPKEVLVRRKVHNNSAATKTGSDAIDVFRIRESDIDPLEPRLVLIDDRLSAGYVYSWTFFYMDQIDNEAVPFYEISDHTV
ncbi:hypothetical protein ACK8P5_26745 (plasmid) [Paenibacillus sp. EC2-1]|uniref:hypothetical protein n=1 Tax=Paenibacillus sp. EC2-1 TaxID=3388665 RepID=UPI003BEED124